MAKKKAQPEADDAPEGETPAAEPKQGFVKKLLGNKKLLIVAAAGLVLVLGGGGAGLYFFVFSAPRSRSTKCRTSS
jgi:flagellar FliL protein